MAYDRIQAHGYKQICEYCVCDAGGAQCIPLKESLYEEAKQFDMATYWSLQYSPTCCMANGQLCTHYWKKYIKPRIKRV